MPAVPICRTDAPWTHVVTELESDQYDRARLRDEFLSMPALCLTVPQVARLLAVTTVAAMRLVTDLERARVLVRTPGGSYRLAARL